MRRPLLPLAVAVLLPGCPQTGELWTCDDPPCEDECDCAALPTEWSRPVTLWRGQPGDVPPCDGEIAWEGWQPFADPPGCPSCSCGPAEATCAPPVSWTARSETCAPEPAQHETDWPPPPAWDGACTAANAIAAGAMCDGAPCVRYVDTGAPVVTLTPCEPVSNPVPKEGHLSTFVRACEARGDTCAGGWCGGEGDCVFLRGEHECPSPWDRRSVLFETVPDADDCTPCECGPPAGGSCDAYVTVFSDDACMSPLGSVFASLCFSVPAGSALGSKLAEILSVSPGSCAPLGGAMTAEPADPVTFCCR